MNRESEGSFLEKPIRDIKRISKELNRTAKSIKTKLCLLDFISDADVSWLDKLQRKDYRNETKKKQTHKMDRRRETKTQKSV